MGKVFGGTLFALIVIFIVLGFFLVEANAAERNFCKYVPFMETTALNDTEGQSECKVWLKGAGLKTEADARRAQERAGAEADAEMPAIRAIMTATKHGAAMKGIPQYVQNAHDYLLGVLKDPDSAKFNPNDGNMYSFKSDGSLYAVCGGVNSKNGFGGYAGEQVWIFVIPTSTVWTEETGATHAMIKHDCTGGTHYSKSESKQ
jgi:hypothetical protein